MSQKQQILRRLRKGPLTPLLAIQQLGVLALSQRCGELRRAGYDIRSEYVEVRCRSGRVARVKRYSLKG